MTNLIHRRRKVDANQQQIIRAFEKLGCFVVDLSLVGKGCPDLLVCKQDSTILVEVKNREGRNKLTDAQVKFIADCPVPVFICHTVDDVVSIVN